MKLHRSWSTRSGEADTAYAVFENSWQVMESFAAGSPAEDIDSYFLWDLRIQLKVFDTTSPVNIGLPCRDVRRGVWGQGEYGMALLL